MAGVGPADPVEMRRGVPVAPFVDDVAKFVGERSVDLVLRGLEERLQQYRMVELKLLTQLKDLQGKVPEIRKSLDVVKRLEQHSASAAQEALVADFEISEGIFTKATVSGASTVCLWLGANVMLEYSLAEVGGTGSGAVGGQLENCGGERQSAADGHRLPQGPNQHHGGHNCEGP